MRVAKNMAVIRSQLRSPKPGKIFPAGRVSAG